MSVKKFCALFLVFAAAFAIFAAPALAADPVRLKLSSTIAVGAPGDLAAKDFVKMVEERTNGAVAIDYYPASQLGSSDEITEQLLTGTLDLNWQTLEWYATFQKDWNVLHLGFAASSREQILKFMASEREAEIEKKLLADDGLRMLANDGVPNPRVLVTTKPINTAEDLVGINMRVPSITLYTKTWQAIGVNCITLGAGDVYMAFKDGMIEATEFPLGSIYSNAWYEVAKHITYTNHLHSIYVMVANEQSWQSKLTDDQRKIIEECAKETTKAYIKYDQESVQKGVDAMKAAGVQINEHPDIASFKAKLANAAAECEAEGLWSAGLYEYLQTLGK